MRTGTCITTSWRNELRNSSQMSLSLGCLGALSCLGSYTYWKVQSPVNSHNKNKLQNKCFGANDGDKKKLYKTNLQACFLAKRDTPLAATLQRKSSGGIHFAKIAKMIRKEVVPRNYLVTILARMVNAFRRSYFR